jgi:hypothetical protein
VQVAGRSWSPAAGSNSGITGFLLAQFEPRPIAASGSFPEAKKNRALIS